MEEERRKDGSSIGGSEMLSTLEGKRFINL